MKLNHRTPEQLASDALVCAMALRALERAQERVTHRVVRVAWHVWKKAPPGAEKEALAHVLNALPYPLPHLQLLRGGRA